MLFKETQAAAEAVAIAVSGGANYDAECRLRSNQLKRFPDWTITDEFRFRVECQDKVFLLLCKYRQAYEMLAEPLVPDFTPPPKLNLEN